MRYFPRSDALFDSGDFNVVFFPCFVQLIFSIDKRRMKSMMASTRNQTINITNIIEVICLNTIVNASFICLLSTAHDQFDFSPSLFTMTYVEDYQRSSRVVSRQCGSNQYVDTCFSSRNPQPMNICERFLLKCPRKNHVFSFDL